MSDFDEEKYEEYRVYRGESKACGYEFVSYEEWLGENLEKMKDACQVDFDACVECDAPVDDGGIWGFCDACAIANVNPALKRRVCAIAKISPALKSRLISSEIILELSCRLADESDYESNLQPKLQILLNECTEEPTED